MALGDQGFDAVPEWPDAPQPSQVRTVREAAAIVAEMFRAPRLRAGGKKPSFVRRAVVVNLGATPVHLSFARGNLDKFVGGSPPEGTFEIQQGIPVYFYVQAEQVLWGTGGPANTMAVSVLVWDEPLPEPR